jgi:predicted house-cleaning noncanonical NTP pyrophosphatase (MazG superfamily)
VENLPEKLVRDKIPEIIQEKGEAPKFRVAGKEELDELLRIKIVEEAHELLESGDTEEIVDIIEAIDSLIQLRNVDQGFLDLQRETKRHFRGGFEKGYVLDMNEQAENEEE